jgi:hypothetical protein
MDQINAWIEANFAMFVIAAVGLYLLGHNGGDLLTWLKSRLTGLFSKTTDRPTADGAEGYAAAYRTLEPILSDPATVRGDVSKAIADLMMPNRSITEEKFAARVGAKQMGGVAR